MQSLRSISGNNVIFKLLEILKTKTMWLSLKISYRKKWRFPDANRFTIISSKLILASSDKHEIE